MKLWLSPPDDWAHLGPLTTCVWLVVALIQTGEVNLTRWLCHLPCRGCFAQSKQRRVRRWLRNARLHVQRLEQPLIQAALAEWQEDSLYLSLDTSLFWDEYCLVRLAVVHRGRALPVVWRVLAHHSASVSFIDYRERLHPAVGRLPQGVKVVLLAARGFIHTELRQAATTQLGWHYRIRLKRTTWLWRAGKGWCQLKTFHFQRGEALCLHPVKRQKQQAYGPVHLIVGRNSVNGEFWAIVSDAKTTLQTFQQYG